MVRGGLLNAPVNLPPLTGLRAACEKYDDLGVRHMPNLWLATTHTVMVVLVVLIELDIAFDVAPSVLDREPRWMLLCYDVAAFLAMYTCTIVYLLAWAMVQELSTPFATDSDDDYNPDALLSSTERTLFASLRANLDAR